MLMVIFGAGASFDSVNLQKAPIDDRSYQPPLAKDLFDPRFHRALETFPDVTPLIDRLRGLPEGTTVEQQLEQFQVESQDYAARVVHLIAVRYYLQQVLYVCGNNWHAQATRVTNYVALLDRLDKWRSKRDETVVPCHIQLRPNARTRSRTPGDDVPRHRQLRRTEHVSAVQIAWLG